MRNSNKVTLAAVAKEFKLKSPHPVQVLSKHLEARGVSPTKLAKAATEKRGRIEGAENRGGSDEKTEDANRKRGRVGNSGRKPISDDVKMRREAHANAVAGTSAPHAYQDVVENATTVIANTPYGFKRQKAHSIIENELRGKGLKTISTKHLVRLAQRRPGERPAPQGGAFFTRGEEEKIRAFVAELRARKFRVSRDLVLTYADMLVAPDDPRRAQLGENGITNGVWPALAKRVGLKTGAAQKLDTARAMWCKSVNFKRWFENFRDVVLAEKIFEVNPDYDDAEPTKNDRLLCVRPEALFSIDETDMSIGGEPKKTKHERSVFMQSGDDQDVATTHTSRKISMEYGRVGTGARLAPMIVYGGSNIVKKAWTCAGLVGDVKDSEGRAVPAVWLANPAGSVDSDFFQVFVTDVLIPSAIALGIRDEVGHRAVFLFDGVQTHVSNTTTLLLLKEAGIVPIPRVPNTSSQSQGEDTVVFRSLMPKYRTIQHDKFRELNAESSPGVYKDFSFEDVPDMLERLFKDKDCQELNKSAWCKDGVLPYTEKVYWDCLHRELALEEQRSASRTAHSPANDAMTRATQLNTTADVDDRVRVNANLRLAVPNPTAERRKKLAQAIKAVQQDDAASDAVGRIHRDQNSTAEHLREALGTSIARTEQILQACLGFIERETPKARSSDVVFEAGGLTSDANLARIQLGIDNATRRRDEEAQRKREKSQKLRQDINEAARVYGELIKKIGTEDVLSKLKKTQLLDVYLAVFHKRGPTQSNKMHLQLQIEGELKKNREMRVQGEARSIELPGVPVRAVENDDGGELPEIGDDARARATTPEDLPATSLQDEVT